MYCHARKCEINVTGATSTGWPTGRKPGARGRAGLVVHGALLEDVQRAAKDRTLAPSIATLYGVSPTTITNLAVVLGLVTRTSHKSAGTQTTAPQTSRKSKAEKKQILKSLLQKLTGLVEATKGKEGKKALCIKANDMRSRIYLALEYNKPLTKPEIKSMRAVCAE